MVALAHPPAKTPTYAKLANFPGLYRHTCSGRYYACKKQGGIRQGRSLRPLLCSMNQARRGKRSPDGYVNFGKTWQEAAACESRRETGIGVEADSIRKSWGEVRQAERSCSLASARQWHSRL